MSTTSISGVCSKFQVPERGKTELTAPQAQTAVLVHMPYSNKNS